MVRTVTTIVFSKMCSHITLPALQLILDVLTQKKDEEDGPLGFEDSEGKLGVLTCGLGSFLFYVEKEQIRGDFCPNFLCFSSFERADCKFNRFLR